MMEVYRVGVGWVGVFFDFSVFGVVCSRGYGGFFLVVIF